MAFRLASAFSLADDMVSYPKKTPRAEDLCVEEKVNYKERARGEVASQDSVT